VGGCQWNENFYIDKMGDTEKVFIIEGEASESDEVSFYKEHMFSM
jgi:hypothetical protein